MKHHITNKKKKKKGQKTRKKDPILKDNFYHYVNNAWFSNTFISKNDSDKSNFTVVQKKVNNELYKCITQYIFKQKIKAATQCKNLYTALTNWNDRLVENQIHLFIKQIVIYIGLLKVPI
jgi:predicted metalloendopeptidase